MYSHILIPTDGSEVSQRGVDHGLALAKALGSRVTVVTVTDPFPSNAGISAAGIGVGREIIDAYDAQQKRHADAILTRAKEAAEALGVAASVLHVPDAYASDAIIDTARAQNIELIVMASHGRRGLGRVFLGSQASGVVNHSPVPVLVVR